MVNIKYLSYYLVLFCSVFLILSENKNVAETPEIFRKTLRPGSNTIKLSNVADSRCEYSIRQIQLMSSIAFELGLMAQN